MASNDRTTLNDISQEQLQHLFKLLEGYQRGQVNLTSFGESSITAPADSNPQPTNQTGPVSGLDASENTTSGPTNNASINMGQVANTLGTIGNITGNAELGQLAQALSIANSVSNADANPASIAQAFAPMAISSLGVPGLGLAINAATNGVSSNTLFGALSMANPLLGTLLGIGNNMAGNPAGALGNTLGNPNSMAIANEAGISTLSQIGNAINTNQSMDQEAMDQMDSLMATLAENDAESTAESTSGAGDSGTSSGGGMSNSGEGGPGSVGGW